MPIKKFIKLEMETPESQQEFIIDNGGRSLQKVTIAQLTAQKASYTKMIKTIDENILELNKL